MNVLINYYSKNNFPLRTAIADHLYSFQRYTPHRCFYINWGVRGFPWYLQHVQFDLIVFHTLFLIERWRRGSFIRLMKRAEPLKQLSGVKVAIPQDEYINTDLLSDFINEFGITHIFSNATPAEWPKIYPTIDFQTVKLSTVMTGYLDDMTIARINRLSEAITNRPIDVGYRAWRAEPWLGRHGMLKTKIADLFQQKALKKGLHVDISTRGEDTLLGDRWYEFLLKCKYTIGVEGGSGIMDRDGSIRAKVDAFLGSNPRAAFEEIEAACFPGEDGSLHLWAISPRHLEACATRTCQVLVEGEYNRVLAPGRHYIELKRDFSNIDQVLDSIKQDELREKIISQAWEDIVHSGKYTYRSFVQMIFEQACGEWKSISKDQPDPFWAKPLWKLGQFDERFSWIWVALYNIFQVRLKLKVRQVFVRMFSEDRVLILARRVRKKVRN